MTTLLERVKAAGVPRHVAIIMDGNGRWAKARGLPRFAGHKAGADVVERLVRHVAEQRLVRYLTLYAFSRDNWRRPRPEIEFLMALFEQYVQEKTGEFVKNGIRFRLLGAPTGLPERLTGAVARAEAASQMGEVLDLVVALNYSGRAEIVSACRNIAEAVRKGDIGLQEVDERAVTRQLYSSELPDVDLVIRTSGEKRISDFLLWQTAYAELLFTETLWPDFTPADFDEALAEYARRERRFGALRDPS